MLGFSKDFERSLVDVGRVASCVILWRSNEGLGQLGVNRRSLVSRDQSISTACCFLSRSSKIGRAERRVGEEEPMYVGLDFVQHVVCTRGSLLPFLDRRVAFRPVDEEVECHDCHVSMSLLSPGGFD